ncbi:hypothetical protein IscW_ISCW016569, partial [Ixodes scapularis]
ETRSLLPCCPACASYRHLQHAGCWSGYARVFACLLFVRNLGIASSQHHFGHSVPRIGFRKTEDETSSTNSMRQPADIAASHRKM